MSAINRNQALANAQVVLDKHREGSCLTDFEAEVFEDIPYAMVGFVLSSRIPDDRGRARAARMASKPRLGWDDATVEGLEKEYLESVAALHRQVAARFDTIAIRLRRTS